MNIIFDMDGVIFDTERFWLDCCIPAAEELNMEGFAEVYPRCIGNVSCQVLCCVHNFVGNNRRVTYFLFIII